MKLDIQAIAEIEALLDEIPKEVPFKQAHVAWLGLGNIVRGIQERQQQLGTPGIRDPNALCADFVPGVPEGSSCEGDGHYLCRECRNKKVDICKTFVAGPRDNARTFCKTIHAPYCLECRLRPPDTREVAS